jgi:hypothetical protein
MESRSAKPMIRFSALLLLTALLLKGAHGADDTFRSDQNHIAATIQKFQASKIKLFLYSLDPNDLRIYTGKFPENSDKVFHRFPILGRTEITSAGEKTDLLKSFAKGILESDGSVASCFNPRHGIRIITGTTTNDFVICFECLGVHAYNFNSDKGFLTSSSPNKVFNKLLDEYHIKKAE